MEIRKKLEYSTTNTASGRQYPKTRVGELLLKTRTEKGQKQREVSQAFPTSFPQGQIDVSNIETHATLASEEVLLAVSDYAGVPIETLQEMWELDTKERMTWINEGKTLAGKRAARSRAKQNRDTPLERPRSSGEVAKAEQQERERRRDEVYRQLIGLVPPPKGPEKLARWAALINELADLAV
jgi:hypothetical protein